MAPIPRRRIRLDTSAQSQAVGAAATTARSYGLRAFIARDLARDLARDFRGHPGIGLLVGPEVMLGLDHADAGMLLDGASQTRASFGAGLRAQLQLRLVGPVWLSLLAALGGGEQGRRDVHAA